MLAFALASALLAPRGPVTITQGLATMVAALAVGVITGAATGRRRAILLAPVAYAAIFELARIGAWGPTVDAPASFGLLHLLAFGLGRFVHGLLAVVPMLAGGLIGLAVAPRLGVPVPRPLGIGGRIVASILAVAVVATGVIIAQPATTAPILGPDGDVLPGSVAELTTARIGGHEQAIMIRGRDASLPVLLHLAGGPGGTDIGAMRLDTGLESDFVVATWDQRGTGKSYPAFAPAETLTLDRVVADTIEVTEYLIARFGHERIYLAGQSWGTIPATLAAQRRPDLYHALIGTGQMVDVLETDQLFYDDTLSWARAQGDTELVERLEAMGSPPYADVIGDYPVIVGPERQLNPYPEFDGRTEMTQTIWGPEFSLIDSVNAIVGLANTYARLYPQLQELDFREQVPELDVPIWIVMGEHEARGRIEPAREWFDALQAPEKHWVVFEASSHRANFERPAEYARLLAEVVGRDRADRRCSAAVDGVAHVPRAIRNDVLRSKAVALTTMAFVAAAAMLVALAAILVVNLSGAIDTLMTRAKTPHFMQMHAGEWTAPGSRRSPNGTRTSHSSGARVPQSGRRTVRLRRRPSQAASRTTGSRCRASRSTSCSISTGTSWRSRPGRSTSPSPTCRTAPRRSGTR